MDVFTIGLILIRERKEGERERERESQSLEEMGCGTVHDFCCNWIFSNI